VGMRLAQQDAEPSLHLAPVGRGAEIEAEHAQRPRRRVRGRPATGQVTDELGLRTTAPPRAAAQHVHDDAPVERVERAGSVGRAEDLRRGTALAFERDLDGIAAAVEPMVAAGEPVTVELEPVTQPWLGDAPAGFEVGEEAVELLEEVLVELADVLGHDGTEQQTAEPGRRVEWQQLATERDASCRRDRAAVPDLELRQQHLRTLVSPRNIAAGATATVRRWSAWVTS